MNNLGSLMSIITSGHSSRNLITIALICVGAVAFKGPAFGLGSGNIWVDAAMCSGNEDTLFECQANSFEGAEDCEHNEDAGVRCDIGESEMFRFSSRVCIIIDCQ